MADTSTSISGPVKIEQTSRESVAFDLMKQIAHAEGQKEEKKDRKYWLTLYSQCHKATYGVDFEKILK